MKSATLARIDATLAPVNAGAPITAFDARNWSTQEWLRFLNGLPRRQTLARLGELDHGLGLSDSPNAYVRSTWLQLAIANRYDPAIPSIEQYLPSVGRMLLIMPVDQALKAQGTWGMPIARRVYARARSGYHPVAAGALDKLLSHIFADGGYAGEQFAGKVADTGIWSIPIIKRSDTAKGFVLLPRRWVVERTFAWLGRNRRLAKDFERTIENSRRLALPSVGPTPRPEGRKPLIL